VQAGLHEKRKRRRHKSRPLPRASARMNENLAWRRRCTHIITEKSHVFPIRQHDDINEKCSARPSSIKVRLRERDARCRAPRRQLHGERILSKRTHEQQAHFVYSPRSNAFYEESTRTVSFYSSRPDQPSRFLFARQRVFREDAHDLFPARASRPHSSLRARRQ
jgi:hypothetical protein